MCFSLHFSVASCLLAIAGFIYHFFQRNVKMMIMQMYFVFMELAQVASYWHIDDCDSLLNKIATVSGVLHVMFQPIVLNFAKRYGEVRPEYKAKWDFLIKMNTIAVIFLVLRIVLPVFVQDGEWRWLCSRYEDAFCGTQTCARFGAYHVYWETRLIRPSYFLPNLFIHNLFMFWAPVAIEPTLRTVVEAILYMLAGPFFGHLFTTDASEMATIWCLFASVQLLYLTLWDFVERHYTAHDDTKKQA